MKFIDKETGEILGKYPENYILQPNETEFIIKIPKGKTGDTGRQGPMGPNGICHQC